jgi:hypothetical protein
VSERYAISTCFGVVKVPTIYHECQKKKGGVATQPLPTFGNVGIGVDKPQRAHRARVALGRVVAREPPHNRVAVLLLQLGFGQGGGVRVDGACE